MAKRATNAQLTEALQQQDGAIAFLTERLAELESTLQIEGWIKETSESSYEFSREGLRELCKLARLYWLKNPLVRRGVNVQVFYVFAQGVNIHARNEDVNAVVQAWLDDEQNAAELTGHKAREDKERTLQLHGNLFFAFFVKPATGRVRLRSIPADEIDEILGNPDDAREVWYYKRSWTQTNIDFETGKLTTVGQSAYYPDWHYQPPPSRPAAIGKVPILWGTPIYHVQTGDLEGMQFGVPEVYPQLDWAKAYKNWLEDWATVARALAVFAWNLTTKGGAKGVATARTKLGTTFAASAASQETNPPPVPGSTWIGSEGVSLTPISRQGANVNPEDGRRLALMIAAGAGLPETFYGDASVGTVATAKSLDRPTELMIKSRQTFWGDIYRAILRYVVLWAVKAPKGALHGLGRVVPDEGGHPALQITAAGADGKPVETTVDVTWPPILEHDVVQQVQAISQAATLAGQPLAGTIDERTVTRLLLSALNVENADEIVEQLWPEGSTQAEQAAAQPGNGAGSLGQPAEQPADTAPASQGTALAPSAEAMMVEAVRDLRTAIRGLVSKIQEGSRG